jgi:hypothetical protein
MPRIERLLTVLAVGALSAGVAVAASPSSHTTPVTADFQASLVSQHQRTCDANRTEFWLSFDGNQTSADPRLAGDLHARVRSVVDTGTGYGTTSGRVLVRDHATGRLKLRATVVGVLEPDGGAEGFLVGRTSGRADRTLLANFNLQQDPRTGAISGELGKDSQTGAAQDPAVLSGACGHG